MTKWIAVCAFGLCALAANAANTIHTIDLPTILRQISESTFDRVEANNETREDMQSPFVMDVSSMTLVGLVIQGEPTTLFFDHYSGSLKVSLVKLTGHNRELEGATAQAIYEAVRERIKKERFAASTIHINQSVFSNYIKGALVAKQFDGAIITKIIFENQPKPSGEFELFPIGYELVDRTGHALSIYIDEGVDMELDIDYRDASGKSIQSTSLGDIAARAVYGALRASTKNIRQKFMSEKTVQSILMNNFKLNAPAEETFFSRLSSTLGIRQNAPLTIPRRLHSSYTVFDSIERSQINARTCERVL